MPATGRDASTHADSTPETRLRARAQELGDLALDTLARLMRGQKAPAPIKLAAAREVLDRGHGRPRIGGPEDASGGGMTVIVKRYTDVTEEELARSEEGEP